jgi:heterodisulfide reductase subunit B
MAVQPRWAVRCQARLTDGSRQCQAWAVTGCRTCVSHGSGTRAAIEAGEYRAWRDRIDRWFRRRFAEAMAKLDEENRQRDLG